MWSVILKEEQRLRIFKNRILREYLEGGSDRRMEETAKVWRSIIFNILHQILLG